MIKICLCTIGKKENLYAAEFVNHYKKIGYDKIFIYNNNDIGDEKFEDVLNSQITSNFVEIINYRGYRGQSQSPQRDAYINCYEKNKNIDLKENYYFHNLLENMSKNGIKSMILWHQILLILTIKLLI